MIFKKLAINLRLVFLAKDLIRNNRKQTGKKKEMKIRNIFHLIFMGNTKHLLFKKEKKTAIKLSF